MIQADAESPERPVRLGSGTALVLACALFLVLRVVLRQAPELMEVGFCAPAAALAALFLGAARDGLELTGPGGVRILVGPACSGVDFFSLLLAATVWHALRAGRRPAVGWGLALPVLYGVTLAVNACRITAATEMRVLAGGLLPDRFLPVLHLTVGAACFLPAFAGIWCLLRRVLPHDL